MPSLLSAPPAQQEAAFSTHGSQLGLRSSDAEATGEPARVPSTTAPAAAPWAAPGHRAQPWASSQGFSSETKSSRTQVFPRSIPHLFTKAKTKDWVVTWSAQTVSQGNTVTRAIL